MAADVGTLTRWTSNSKSTKAQRISPVAEERVNEAALARVEFAHDAHGEEVGDLRDGVPQDVQLLLSVDGNGGNVV